MANFRKSDTYCVSFKGTTFLAQDSDDLFADNSHSLLPQQTQDFCANSLEGPTTDPQEGPSCKKIRINCEEYLKDSSTSDESSDDDVTPDLDFTTTSRCHKTDINELSNNPEEVKKTFCNWNLTPEASNDCDKFEHSLTVNVDSAESDKSDHTHTTDVDSIQCNMLGCNYSHTCAYKKETDNTNSGEYLTPSLETFRNSIVEISGNDIIQEMSFYKHKLRECEQKLIEEYNISPVTVKRWMDLL